jgi:phosphatidylserine/phosphatidylglycerophosphate/cardiolipin synthase-like enzyme
MVKMPWHDIHSCIQGPAVLDVSRHFVERWNYSKSNENSEGITNIKTVYTRRVSIGTDFFKGFLGNAIQKVIEKENNINHEENNKEDENNKNINFSKENIKDNGNYNNEKEKSSNGAFNNYRNLNSSNNNFNNNNF